MHPRGVQVGERGVKEGRKAVKKSVLGKRRADTSKKFAIRSPTSDLWHLTIHFRSPAKNRQSISSHVPGGSDPIFPCPNQNRGQFRPVPSRPVPISPYETTSTGWSHSLAARDKNPRNAGRFTFQCSVLSLEIVRSPFCLIEASPVCSLDPST